MGKMPCCKTLKELRVGIELTRLLSHLASKSHQRIEIENNYNQAELKTRIEIDHTRYQTCKTTLLFKVTNLIEDSIPCLNKNNNSIMPLAILAPTPLVELAHNRCSQTWMKWTSQVNTKIIWNNNFQRICHILRESSITKSFLKRLTLTLTKILGETTKLWKLLSRWWLQVTETKWLDKGKYCRLSAPKICRQWVDRVFLAFQSSINPGFLGQCNNHFKCRI